MAQEVHQIRRCLKPACRFRFPNNILADQYVYCPKCGSPTEVVETPYMSMVVDKSLIENEIQIEVLLDNIRSAYNVGSIIRTSDGVGISHIHFCGITPTPDNPKVSKTALYSEFHTPWTQYWNSVDAATKLKEQGYFLIALEGGEGAFSIFDKLDYPLPDKMVLVIGNEVSGVDPGTIAICNYRVWLPMLGKKQSFNVSVAFGIAAYIFRFKDYL
jgi:23S rRNA (guanosine2251-2'-O)-methyltransferase